jgi:hypothetical protein
MGFAVDKVGQVYPQVIRLSFVNIITTWLSILVYHLGDKQLAHWWPQLRDAVSQHRHEQGIKTDGFCDVIPCSLEVDRRFGGVYRLHHQGDIMAIYRPYDGESRYL